MIITKTYFFTLPENALDKHLPLHRVKNTMILNTKIIKREATSKVSKYILNFASGCQFVTNAINRKK